jgi:hypothetical protein
VAARNDAGESSMTCLRGRATRARR